MEQTKNQLLIIKWLCDENEWASKYMHVLSKLIGTEFTTKQVPYKSSHSYELIKEWESKGLIKVSDYTNKSRKYAFTTTLFARAIENKQIPNNKKQEMLNKLDEIIHPIWQTSKKQKRPLQNNKHKIDNTK